MRCLSLPLAAAAAAILGLSAQAPATADEATVRVPTSFLTHAQHARTGARPGDLVADFQATDVVPLGEDALPGLGAVPAGARLLYGSFQVGGRRFLLALGAAAGGRALMAVDLDGDGNLRGDAEVTWGTGRRSRLRGRPIFRWKFPAQQLGSMKLDVTFQQLDRAWNAVMIGDAPSPLALTEAPPEGVRPLTMEGHARYAHIATAQGEMSIAFVRGAADRLTILTDANRNGTLGEAGEMIAAPVSAREVDATFWQTADVVLGGSSLSFAYQELVPHAQATWKVGVLGARRGSVQVEGVEYALHLLDADFDGSYASSSDFWWFGPAKRLERLTRLLPISMIEANQPFYLATPWRLAAVGPDGAAVIRRDPAAPPCGAYFHQRTDKVNRERWFPMFEGDNAFVERWKIDSTRPQILKPHLWHHGVSVEEGLRLARAEGKPLLVDFEADWCNICKRWDYHVYSDTEIAYLLKRFVCLKINVDFDHTSDLERLEGKNPPYLVFLDVQGQPLLRFPEVDSKLQPTGRKLHGLTYFQRPTDFAATLRAALDANVGR